MAESSENTLKVAHQAFENLQHGLASATRWLETKASNGFRGLAAR